MPHTAHLVEIRPLFPPLPFCVVYCTTPTATKWLSRRASLPVHHVGDCLVERFERHGLDQVHVEAGGFAALLIGWVGVCAERDGAISSDLPEQDAAVAVGQADVGDQHPEAPIFGDAR